MKWLYRLLGVAAAIFLLLFPAYVLAATTSQLLITKIVTGQKAPNGGASDELIEIYNNTPSAVDLANWKIEYLSAGGKSWSGSKLNGTIDASSLIVLASPTYTISKTAGSFSFHLSESGGHVRLSSVNGSVISDLVGYGTASQPLGTAAPKPGDGNELIRSRSGTKFVNSGNNSADFTLNKIFLAETAGSTDKLIVPNSPTTSQTPEETISKTISFDAEINISELMPNPASPATDAKDEFIELFNPNTTPVNLTGYKLQTGSTFSKSYLLKQVTIAPDSFLVFYSKDTKLTLANGSGHARLIAPDGSVKSVAADYQNAPSGQAWIYYGNNWQWSTTPTPLKSNILTLPQPKAAEGAKLQTILQPKAIKKTAVKAPKTSKIVKPTMPKTASNLKLPNSAVSQLNKANNVHPLLLASIGTLVVGYAIYEYRIEFTNQLQRFRLYRATRRAHRKQLPGR